MILIEVFISTFMRSRGLKVKKDMGEKTRLELIAKGFLDRSKKILSDNEHVFLPLKNSAASEMTREYGDIIYMEFESFKHHPKSYRDLLDLQPELMELLPTSFDIIGEICIIKLPEALLECSASIGKAIMETRRSLRSVALDRGVKGDFRIRDLQVIAGEDQLETIHVENNLRFKLDPSKVYFSPRLATERRRIAEKIDGGRVLDMFAGVGPFSLTCARYGKPDEIIGLDLNPYCIEYFNTNIRLNSAEDTVTAFLGDAKEAPLGMGPFNTIIMNLPHGSIDFLDTALEVIDGGSIFLYSIVKKNDVISTIDDIVKLTRDCGKEVVISSMREVHEYSPDMSMMAFDMEVRASPSPTKHHHDPQSG